MINFLTEKWINNWRSNLCIGYSDSCQSEQGSITQTFTYVTVFDRGCRWSSR